jgi:hypothetical protein
MLVQEFLEGANTIHNPHFLLFADVRAAANARCHVQEMNVVPNTLPLC